jgi:hypothetical protein
MGRPVQDYQPKMVLLLGHPLENLRIEGSNMRQLGNTTYLCLILSEAIEDEVRQVGG